MIVDCLVENTAIQEGVMAEHGLSLHITTSTHRILFDFGQTDAVFSNAEHMCVDLTKVDMAVLSHGHYDHCGGLERFMALNPQVKVYIHEAAFETHLSDRGEGGIIDIGIRGDLRRRAGVTPTHTVLWPDRGLLLFSDVDGQAFLPKGNRSMLVPDPKGGHMPDDFRHEQNLLVEEGDSLILMAGCAHKGILNIMEKAREHMGRMPDIVFGGFHLSSRNPADEEPQERIERLGEALAATGATFYTGHCTGVRAFDILKDKLGDKLFALTGGQRIII